MQQTRKIKLEQGFNLNSIDRGSGEALIMIPGWSQSAAEFGRNIEELSNGRRVIALDMRGHGESDKPEGGYRVQRLAKDLDEVIDALGLKSVDVLGHSMGSSVVWSYLDLFGPAKLRKFIVVDQAPMAAALPAWSKAERLRYGCLFPDPLAVAARCDVVRAAGTAAETKELIRGMFTAAVSEADLDFIAAENVKMPRAHAADLLFDHCLNDWRDVIGANRLPTLVIGGRNSIFPAESQEWIASVNPNAKASIYEGEEGGGHFMFYENPKRFNREVGEFLLS